MEYLSRTLELSNFIGVRLHSLTRGDLLIDGEQNLDDLGPLELVFESGSTLQLRLVSDGESLEFRLSPARPSDLLGQGGVCPWPRIELSQHTEYRRFCQQRLIGIDAIHFGFHPEESDPEVSEVLAGLIFNFESGDSLAYCNFGDFAKIYINASPPPLPKPFYFSVRNALVSA